MPSTWSELQYVFVNLNSSLPPASLGFLEFQVLSQIEWPLFFTCHSVLTHQPNQACPLLDDQFSLQFFQVLFQQKQRFWNKAYVVSGKSWQTDTCFNSDMTSSLQPFQLGMVALSVNTKILKQNLSTDWKFLGTPGNPRQQKLGITE